jgi:hypothetical protein
MSSVEAEQRKEMAELLAERVKRDFDARSSQARRQALRTERRVVEEADVASVERIARAREEFAAEYNATVEQFARRLGPLILRQIELQPSPLDPSFYPPEDLQRRLEDRQRVDRELAEARAEMARELRRLQSEHEARTQELRTAAREEALAKARTEALGALADLEVERRKLQTQLEADLERVLQSRPEATAPPPRDLPAERREVGGEIVALNRAVAVHTAAQRAATEATIASLARQRRNLATLIEAATRAVAQDVAAERNVRLRFDGRHGDPELTEWVAARLSERWATPAPRAGSSRT